MWQAIAVYLQHTVQIFVLAWLAFSIVIEFLTWLDDREGTLFEKQGLGWLTARHIGDDGKKRKRYLAPYFFLEWSSPKGYAKYPNSEDVDDDLDPEILTFGWFLDLLSAGAVFGLAYLFGSVLSGTTVLIVSSLVLLVYLPFPVKGYIRCRKQLAQAQATTEIPPRKATPDA